VITSGFNTRPLVQHAPQFGRMLPEHPILIANTTAEIGAKPGEVLSGGLSVVSNYIRDQLPHHSNQTVAITTIQPHLKSMQRYDQELKRRKQQPYENTGFKIHLKAEGVSTPIEVLQRQHLSAEQKKLPAEEQKLHGWTYSLKHPLFNEENLFTYVSGAKNKVPKPGENLPLTVTDQVFSKNMIRTRASAKLLQTLQSGKVPEGTKLHVFPQKFHAIIANDWMDGPLFHELDTLNAKQKETASSKQADPKYIFFTHNQYSEDRPLSHSARIGLEPPTDPKLLRAAKANHEGQTEGMYSPLSMGMHKADLILIDKNYALTHATSPLTQEHIFRDILKDKVDADKVAPMHHAPNFAMFDPLTSPALKREGFANLKPTDKNMAEFKAINKKALQRKLKLKQDPNAVVELWMARLEPGQKGFNMLRDTMLKSLKKNPDLQIVVWGQGDDSDKVFQASLKKLKSAIDSDSDLKSRVHIPNKATGGHTAVQSYAGTDFLDHPSMYEPFGISPLEGYLMGTPSIVHGVDGLRTIVSDPAKNGKSWIPAQNVDPKMTKSPEKVWDYGQTGFMIDPVAVLNYRRSLFRISTLASSELKLKQAGAKNADPILAGMKEGVGNIAKEALFDSKSGLTTEKDGFTPPKFSEKEIAILEDIKTRLIPKALPGTDSKVLQKAKEQPMTASEQKSLLADISTLKGIFQKADQAVQDDANHKLYLAREEAMKVAKNPDQIGEIRRNGRRYVLENHSPEAIAHNYLRALRKLLPGHFADTAPPPYAKQDPELPAYSPKKLAVTA